MIFASILRRMHWIDLSFALFREVVSSSELVSERLSNHLKGLILAQNERCRRGLGMQVERESVECGFGQVKQRTAANGVVIYRLRTLGSGIAMGNCG